MDDAPVPAPAASPPAGLVTLTHVMYGLHAFSALSGLLSPAFILTAFLTGWPSIIAVIINYLKRDQAHSTYLASHFRWQIRTFWFALLWLLISLLLAFTFIGIPIALLIGVLTGIWIIYRILRGWLRLTDTKPIVF